MYSSSGVKISIAFNRSSSADEISSCQIERSECDRSVIEVSSECRQSEVREESEDKKVRNGGYNKAYAGDEKGW